MIFGTIQISSTLAQTVTSQGVSSKKTCTKFINSLGMGDGFKNNKSDLVHDLQKVLFDKGYLKVNPTGYFGRLTSQAVKAYQKDNNISQTGYVGEKTRGALQNHFCDDSLPSVCDYPAPPADCTYVPGPNYNEKSGCGMTLSCNGEVVVPLPSPSNCKVWFDGCNTCSKTTPGGLEACTRMACPSTNTQQSYCREYFDTTLTEKDARSIAIAACSSIPGGTLSEHATYNEISKTWWFSGTPNNPSGCFPACVVSDQTKTAEINYRCTGLLMK